MSHHESIRNVLAALAFGGDLGEAALAASCFTEDGVFAISGFPPAIAEDSETAGREQLRRMYEGLFAVNQGNVRHWVGNTFFRSEPQPDRAVDVHSYFALIRVGIVPKPGIVMTGTYSDRFVFDDGQWRIRHRQCLVDPLPSHRHIAPTDALLMRLDDRTSRLDRATAQEGNPL